MKRLHRLARALVALAMVLVPATGLLAGAKVTLGRQWPAGQQLRLDRIDHATFDVLLKKYVDPQGLVDYGTWKASPADMQGLDAYIELLSRGDPNRSGSRDATMAFWINAYNAVTIRGILREYPTSSIRNHTARVFGYNIWNDLLLNVGGRPVSLGQMENEILRKMGDPRIHFAIVCASIGCPKLRNEAYTPDRLEEQLAKNAHDFFADSQKFRYDPAASQMALSPILQWYASDFGATAEQQLATISPYLPDEAARQAAARGAARLSFLGYDWGLNDQARRR
ncbi:MAG: DUF547 domain-containing protein [Pirellulales bacterium]